MANRSSGKLFGFYIFALIVTIGIFLRVFNLDKQSIWGDEARAFFRAQKSIGQLWDGQVNESNPPLYDMLLHFYLKNFSKKNDFSVRLFPAIFGVLLIPFGFWVGKRIFNGRVGILFSFLLAISPYHIYYSQDTKMYSLLALLSLASFFFYYLSLNENKPAYWAAYVLATVLLVYCHNYGALFLSAELIYFIFRKKTYGASARFLFSQLVMLPFLLPRIACLFQQSFMDLNPWIKTNLISDTARTFVYFSVVMRHLDITAPVIIALIIGLPIYMFIFGFAIFGKSNNHDDAEKKLFLFSHFFVPLALALIISLKKPIFYAGRYDMVVFPLFCLIIGYGLDKINKDISRRLLIAFIMVIAAIILKNYYLDFKKSNDREVSAYIQARISEDDVLVFTNLTFPAFRYYWRKDFQPRLLIFPDIDSGSLPKEVYEDNREYIHNEIMNIRDKIRFLSNKHNLLWVMYSKDFLINKRLIHELISSYQLLDIVEFKPGNKGNQITGIYIFKM